MSDLASTLVLAAFAVAGGMLLLVPGLVEWLRPRDSEPLAIDMSYSRRDTHFADRFRRLAESWWQAAGPGGGRPLLALEDGEARETTLLAARILGGAGVSLREEAWAKELLELGPASMARALLSEGELRLGANCTVRRWVHATAKVALAEGCHLGARATSDDVLVVQAGCRSPLLAAPNIQWHGRAEDPPVDIPTHARPWLRRRRIPEVGKTFDVPRRRVDQDGTTFVHGDLILDEEADVDFPLVVWGNLYLRKGALIAGDIKAHGDLVVEGSVVVGNLSCKGRLVVAGGSAIQGCLRGDALVWLGDGVIVGRPERQEAVVGDHVRLAGSGTVHGRIRALAGWVEVAG